MIKQFIPGKACLACQGCCRFEGADTIWSPRILNGEIMHFQKNRIPLSLISADKRIRLISDSKGESYLCPFFDSSENKCRIYSFRPFDCELYPFLTRRQGKKVFLALDLNCPFAAKNLNSQTFKGHVRYLTAFFSDPSIIRILKDNPQIVQSYSGVKNIIRINL